MHKQIYIAQGTDPSEWSENDLLGPFTSEKAAKEAIKQDINTVLENADMLSKGRDENWCNQYHLLEFVKTINPVLDVSVKISLRNVKS
jgi:hypothetical protein